LLGKQPSSFGLGAHASAVISGHRDLRDAGVGGARDGAGRGGGAPGADCAGRPPGAL